RLDRAGQRPGRREICGQGKTPRLCQEPPFWQKQAKNFQDVCPCTGEPSEFLWSFLCKERTESEESIPWQKRSSPNPTVRQPPTMPTAARRSRSRKGWRPCANATACISVPSVPRACTVWCKSSLHILL